jgi:hypothetical protein
MATSGSCRAAPTADRSPCSASPLAAARSLRSTFWLIQSVSTDSICQLSKAERLDKAELLSDRIRRRRQFLPRDGVHIGIRDGFARSAGTRSQSRASYPSFRGILRVRANFAHAVGLRSSASTRRTACQRARRNSGPYGSPVQQRLAGEGSAAGSCGRRAMESEPGELTLHPATTDSAERQRVLFA